MMIVNYDASVAICTLLIVSY